MAPLFLVLILIILLIRGINPNVCNTEKFTQGYIIPYHMDEYNTSSPDTEYYLDRSGTKGILYNHMDKLKEPDRIFKQTVKKNDNFNKVIHNLELYNMDVYNNCSPL